MRQDGFRPVLLVMLLVVLLAAGACAPPFPAAPVPPTIAPTEIPFPTSTAATPPPPYATEVATHAAASPFPTAAPAIIEIGEPLVATARRNGLSLEVRLAKDTYLAGEGARAEATLRNDTPETIFVDGTGDGIAGLTILDERGQEPAPWPWSPLSMPGMPRGGAELAPGQVLTGSLAFQVLPLDRATDHSYALWAEVRFARPDPVEPRGPDNRWLRLEAGPIPLQVIAPNAAQQLQAEVWVDRDTWMLRVRDGTGQTPPGPFWGVLEAVSHNGARMQPLKDDPDGIWSGSLDSYLFKDGAPVAVRAWIAAPGYVTGAAIVTMPGANGDEATFYTGEPPVSERYGTLEAAQTASCSPLYRPGVLPAGASIEDVQVDTWGSDDSYRVEATQFYRLARSGWLELGQTVYSEPRAGFGWGQARYDGEAEVVAVGQTTGYVIQRFGWWALDWKCGDTGLELRAPVEALSLEELVAVAAEVKSPDGACPPEPTPAPPPTPPAPPTRALPTASPTAL